MRRGALPSLAGVVTLAATLAGCSGEPSTPSTTPPTSDAPYTITVSPPEAPLEVRTAIPGQRVSFLIRVDEEAVSGAPVVLSAEADGATVEDVSPAELAAGTVGEIWVVIDPAQSDTTASVTIEAMRGDRVVSETRSIPVMPMVDEREVDARRYFDLWTGWLVANHPELGITESTQWDPEFVSILLVVSHYAYFSEEWEMTVAWHNMIPPYDWTEVHLRKRWEDLSPSLAFKIDSVSGETAPYAIPPPEVVVR